MDEQTRAAMIALLPRLRRFCHGLAGNSTDGDDLVQLACERATSRIHQFQRGTRLDSWMFRIAQSIWLNQVRSRKVSKVEYDSEAVERQVGEEGEAAMLHRLTYKQTLEAMSRLSHEHREVLMLVCIEGFSYADTASMLDVKIGTVMSRLARARNHLRDALT